MNDVWERLRPYLRDWRVLTGVAAVLIVVAAGGLLLGGQEPAPSIPTPPIATTTTAQAPTTTAGATTTAVAVAAWPLSGEMAGDPAQLTKRVLVAKIDNSPQGRPQIGLAEADLVIEVLVEGGIARLLAFYHSQDAAEVGPVRSVREVDPKLLAPFVPLMVHSGGVPQNEAAMREVAFDLGQPVVPEAYLRADDRRPPYDLIAVMEQIRAAGPPPAEQPLTSTLTFGEPAQEGEAAGTVSLDMSQAHRVVYRYSEVDGGYLRYNGDDPHEGADGGHLTATNVVVLRVERLETGRTDVSGAAVPDWEVLGTGEAVVFRGGQAIPGRWERGRREDFFRLIDGSGAEIPLQPGSTWIELVPLDAGVSWE